MPLAQRAAPRPSWPRAAFVRLLPRAALFAAALALAAPAGAQELVVRRLQAVTFAAAHEAVLDAIAAEGIAPPTESDFGGMLARTAPDLGHRADFYAEARLINFCSSPLAARMAAESPHQLLYCPLQIAVYRLPDDAGAVYLGYRRSAPTAAGRAAETLLEAILNRSAAELGRSLPGVAP
ncbi:DUF302 domain-containing protein [Azoarcus olearius]|uniref:Hypothetical secreted protein n=1 Tax=Azoarcus sp. (strain BH72) TaxID=418699 RepID=A1K9Y5_AZOSB|nr:DUF302 domain-containing protein [Azoarcus olearius]ANQ86187.1 hypothetical protein dqs_3159 [Azoarcus olearius]CAL95640.1 hypothetical secreted protein [Azoarcus olearius]